MCTSSKLRIFADNNITECQYCSQTNHPSYRCVRKPSMAKAQACFRCNSKDHTIKDCPHSDNVCYNCGKEGHIRRNWPQSVILGALNCTRLVFENPNVHNISVSGTTLDQVQTLLDKSDSQVDSENVDSVVLSLGTNDVTQYRNDTEQIIVNVTTMWNINIQMII